MDKTLVGMVTYGNTKFSKLALESVRSTTKQPINFIVVVGKPGDEETIAWLKTMPEVVSIVHENNHGFPNSINDMFDHAWKENDYDNFILMGNDVVAYPGCVDGLISTANETDYSLVSALQLDVKSLLATCPGSRKYFSSEELIFTDFSSKPWEEYTDYSDVPTIADMQMHDIQNFCLYKKSAFDTLGYVDTRFYPAYYADNDYVRRLVRSDLKYCTLVSSRFFHFWSRTLYQGGGSASTPDNWTQYKKKWGGMFGEETLSPDIYIGTR